MPLRRDNNLEGQLSLFNEKYIGHSIQELTLTLSLSSTHISNHNHIIYSATFSVRCAMVRGGGGKLTLVLCGCSELTV